jgi:hypothetical protein
LNRLEPIPEELAELVARRVLLAALLTACVVVGGWIWRDLFPPLGSPPTAAMTP